MSAHRSLGIGTARRSRRASLLLLFSIAASVTLPLAQSPGQEAAELKEKVAALEKRIADLEKSQSSGSRLQRLREEAKRKARRRAAEDRKHYSPAELAEIESLYQVANKNWRSEEARQSLKELLMKYDKSNRTGCATLYMGQMTDGAERLEYLTRTVEKFSDCYYLDGCEVGGYGRYVLALTLWESGKQDEAKGYLQEIRSKYKDAIDHRGRPMIELVEAAERELGIK